MADRESSSLLDSILTVSDVGADDSVGFYDGPEDVGVDVAVGRLRIRGRTRGRALVRFREEVRGISEIEEEKGRDLTIPTAMSAPCGRRYCRAKMARREGIGCQTRRTRQSDAKGKRRGTNPARTLVPQKLRRSTRELHVHR